MLCAAGLCLEAPVLLNGTVVQACMLIHLSERLGACAGADTADGHDGGRGRGSARLRCGPRRRVIMLDLKLNIVALMAHRHMERH